MLKRDMTNFKALKHTITKFLPLTFQNERPIWPQPMSFSFQYMVNPLPCPPSPSVVVIYPMVVSASSRKCPLLSQTWDSPHLSPKFSAFRRHRWEWLSFLKIFEFRRRHFLLTTFSFLEFPLLSAIEVILLEIPNRSLRRFQFQISFWQSRNRSLRQISHSGLAIALILLELPTDRCANSEFLVSRIFSSVFSEPFLAPNFPSFPFRGRRSQSFWNYWHVVQFLLRAFSRSKCLSSLSRSHFPISRWFADSILLELPTGQSGTRSW